MEPEASPPRSCPPSLSAGSLQDGQTEVDDMFNVNTSELKPRGLAHL